MSNELIPFAAPPNSTGVMQYLGQSDFTLRGNLFSGLLSSKFTEMGAAAMSDYTNQVSRNISKLIIPPSPSALTFEPYNKPVEEKLFDATASVKVLASKVAMHLDTGQRNKLFKQIDSLHDIDEWDKEDSPIKATSFETFLKAFLLISPKVHPGLGLSYEGNLIATWGNLQDRLITEFLPKGLVRFVLSRTINDDVERATGETSVARLYDCLSPYQPDHWFYHE